MHCVTLVFACVCAVTANIFLSSNTEAISTRRISLIAVIPSNLNLKYPNNSPAAPKRKKKINNSPFKNSSPKHKISQQDERNDVPLMVETNTSNYLSWESSVMAPARPERPGKNRNYDKKILAKDFYKALIYFDDAQFDIKQFLNPKNKKNVRFIHFYYMTQVYAQEVARYGVKAMEIDIMGKNVPVKDMLEDILCYLNSANQKIMRLRKLMENDWVHYVCGKNLKNCDVLIDGIINWSGDKQILKESETLLKFGYAAFLYLEKFADDILKWAMLSDVSLKEMKDAKGPHWFTTLVNNEASVHKEMFKSGRGCF